MNGSGSWSQTNLANDTYTLTYDVVDQGVRVADLAIDVAGARDALGRTRRGLCAAGRVQHRYGQSHGDD